MLFIRNTFLNYFTSCCLVEGAGVFNTSVHIIGTHICSTHQGTSVHTSEQHVHDVHEYSFVQTSTHTSTHNSRFAQWRHNDIQLFAGQQFQIVCFICIDGLAKGSTGIMCCCAFALRLLNKFTSSFCVGVAGVFPNSFSLGLPFPNTKGLVPSTGIAPHPNS